MVVGFLGTNCHIVACEETSVAAVIDPGIEDDEADKITREIDKRALQVKYIVNTHGHADHISGNGRLKQKVDAEILIHKNDVHMLSDPRRNLSVMLGFTVVSPPADRLLSEGDEIWIGRLRLEVIHTPGHSSGSISLYAKDESAVFTGDTLSAGSVGRWDLPDSSFTDLVRSLRGKLLTLPDHTVVYPGHGERTTIGKEKRHNPFANLREEPFRG